MSSVQFDATLNTDKLDSSVKESKKTVKDWAKDVEKAGDDMDRSFSHNSKTIKEAITQQKLLVKELESDLKKLEKAYQKSAPGEAQREATKRLTQEKAYLAQEQSRLIDLQEEQVRISKAEEEAANSLTGVIGKWALSLGGAAAALSAIKKALTDTTAGLNTFNIVGQSARQIMYNLVSGSASLTAGLRQVIEAQRILNELRLEEKVVTYEAAQQKILYNKYSVEAHDQTLTSIERIKAYDEAIAAHGKMIDMEIDLTRKQLAATEDLLEARPGSDKLKMEYADLNTKILELEARRFSALKEMTSMRSGLIKKETQDELDRRKMIDDWLKAIEEEQVERAEKHAAKLKELNEQIAVGNLKEQQEKELLQLQQQYDDELQLYEDNEAIKIALAEKYAQDRYAIEMKYLDKIKAENTKMAAALLKIDPGKGFAMISRALSSTGTKPIGDISTLRGTNQTQEGIEKKVNENLEEQLRLRQEILYCAADLVYQIGEALGLSEDQLDVLNSSLTAFTQMVSGNWVGAVTVMISTLIAGLGDRTDDFADKIENINRLIEQQNLLLKQAERAGGEKEAIENLLKTLKAERALYEEQVRIARINLKDAQAAFFGIGWQVGKRKEELQALEDALRDIDQQIFDTQQSLDDLLTGGVTQNTIADVIAEGFREGKLSVDDFAEYMNDVLLDAILEVFKVSILGDAMNELQDYISGALSDKILTTEEKQEIDERIKALADSNKELWENLTQGLDLGAEAPEGLAGGIRRQITEETGTELAGLFRRFADDSRLIRDYNKQGMSHLASIEANTYNTVEELKLAVTELKDINKNTKPVYSGDL